MRNVKTGAVVDYDSLTDELIESGLVYSACQCPCGCTHSARYFAPDTSDRPYLCMSCMPPYGSHFRDLTPDEQAVVELPA